MNCREQWLAAAGGATHASHGRPWMDALGFREAWNAQRNGPRRAGQ